MGDVRLAIPTTALLTMIFLQQAYRSDIPSLSYFSFLDWLYMYAYVVSICFFVLFACGTYRYNTASEDQKPQAERSIDRIDSVVQVIALLALLTMIPLAWFFA
jgi:Ca2+/Na+ antiporter